MNQNLTEIACVVDRSGSMASIRSDAIGGFNTFLEGQKAHPGRARLTLVLFDHEYQVVHDGKDIRAVPPLDEATYMPRGTTALLDAIGRTVDDIGARLARTPEAQRPGKVIVSILTDGLENASKDYTRERIATMIEHQRTKYGWDFIFLAANQDAIQVAAGMAIPAQDAIGYAATAAGTRAAWDDLNATVRRRRG